MASAILSFTEVEHDGDLSAYASELASAGVRVTGRGIGSPEGEPDPGSGWLRVEYGDGKWETVAASIRSCQCSDFISFARQE